MLKVLIVDDELLARLALRTAIPWKEHGFEVVAEAEDGLTGFQYVQKYRPDIVLTDISMPGMNGVELIQKTKEFCPDIELIILSCHNDFEYVKEGLRSGASDYILKLSMSMDELLKELLHLKDKILKRQIRVEASEGKEGREQWPGLLFSLITQEEPIRDEALAEAKKSGLLGEGDYVLLAILAVDCEEGEVPNYNQNTMIEHLAAAVMTRYKVGYYIPFELNRGVVLCQIDDIEAVREKTASMKNMMEELLGLIHDYHGVPASAGISLAGSLSQIKICYRQAYEALQQKFYTGPGQVHVYTEIVPRNLNESSEDSLKDLMKIADTNNLEEIRRQANLWLDRTVASEYPAAGMVRQNIHQLLFKINSNMILTDREEAELEPVEMAYHKIQKQVYLEEMRETLNTFLKKAESSNENSKDIRREVIQAKQYVAQYYRDNIKLSAVAEHVNMNVDYFSHIFKKETGSSFTDYLNGFRIEKAKQLLRSGQYKVYEVAFAVGFQDENYFIRRFKKQTGYTPLEFLRL